MHLNGNKDFNFTLNYKINTEKIKINQFNIRNLFNDKK